MSRWRRSAAALLGAACLMVTTARSARAEPANASDLEEARKHDARGVVLYEQGADAASLAELERAYALAPNWKVLYELGVVELAVHDFAGALRHFEQYLVEGGEALKAARKQEVQDDVARLRAQVATIDFVVAAGAEVLLDDVPVGTTPFAKPLVVNPGHHKLVAWKDGVAGETRMVSVTGGDHATLALSLPSPPAPPPPVPPPAPVPGPDPLAPEPAPLLSPTPVTALEAVPAPRLPRASTLWIGWVTAGAFASAAIVTGVEALRANGDLTRAKNDGPSSAGTLGSLSSRAHALALASDLSTGGAIVAGGATLFLTLRPRPHSPSTATLFLGVGAGCFSLRGTF